MRNKVSVVLFLFVLFYALCFQAVPLLFLHFDLGWHIELGDIIRRSGSVPAVDPWSSTARGFRFVQWYWLWDIPASYLYELTSDFRALFVFTAVQVGLLVAVVGWHLLLRGCSELATVLISILFGLSWFLGSAGLPGANISARTAGFLLFAICHLVIYRVSVRARILDSVLLVPLIAVWGNVHSLATLSLPMFGLFTVQAIANRKFRAAAVLCGAVLAGFLGVALLHPMGFDAWRMFPLTSGDTSETLGNAPYNFRESASALFLVVFVVLLLVSKVRTEFADQAHAMFWLLLGLKSADAFPLFLIAAAPLTGVMADGELGKMVSVRKLREVCRDVASQFGTVALVVVAMCSVVVAEPILLSRRYPEGLDYPQEIYPAEGLRFLEGHYQGRKVLTDWNFGGFIIHKAHGRLPVFIDGRGPGSYPPEVLRDYAELNSHPEKLLDKYGSEVTFLRNQLPANIFLRTSTGWKLAYQDRLVSIFEKLGPAAVNDQPQPTK